MPFVSFEGIDGAGKTTQLRRTAEWLSELGAQVVKTKEPDGGRIGASVRRILVDRRLTPLNPTEELLLVFAARFDHVRSVIRPALVTGSWVLTDRFVDSTYALQVHGTEMPIALFAAAANAVVGKTMPDLTLILDLDVETAMFRRRTRGGLIDDPAELTRDFDRIAQGFRAIAAREPGRCRLVDATGDEGDVFDEVRKTILASGMLIR